MTRPNNSVLKFDDETILKLFGAQAAEDETLERLQEYFIRNKAYERVLANLKLRLLVGHKGIGKSALVKMAHQEEQTNKRLSIWLQPTDIASAWSVEGTFVERVEGIKKNLLSIVAKKILEELSIFGFEPGKNNYIQSAKQLATTIISSASGANFEEVEAEIIGRFKNDRKIFVHIDDIDRGWSASNKDVENISALINASRDLTNSDDTLTFRIGLRTDAYNLVREHDESGDKFEPYLVPITWENHDILILMAKRVASYFGDELDVHALRNRSQKQISEYLYPVIEEDFQASGHWAKRPIHNVLLSLTRRRPRDLIKLLAGAAAKADEYDNNRILTVHLTDSFPEYSKGRITDLVSEFGSELPRIKDVVYSMKPTKKEQQDKDKRHIYSVDEIVSKLNSIANNQSIFFSNGQKASGISLLNFLFKIDFVIARKDVDGGIDRLYYQDHPNLISSKTDFGYKWEVHPAYRWALDPNKVDEILSTA